jgi:hypothetical protein
LTVSDIKLGQHDVLKSHIEKVGLVAVGLELGGTGKYETLDVWFIISNEMVSGKLTNLSYVVVTLFFSDTSETHGRLTTTSVLLWQLDQQTLEDFLSASRNGGIQHTITIDNNESECFIVFHQVIERAGLESGLAAVSERVDLFEGLNIERDLLLTLTITCFDHTAKEGQAILWDFSVKLKL